MSDQLETNKAMTRKIYEELFGEGNLDLVDDLFHEDFVWHTPNGPEGAWRMKQAAASFRSAFPDLVVTIEDQIAEGEKVMTRLEYSGTHTGNFQGYPGTGRRFSINALGIDRISDGKVMERWNSGDNLGLMQQLGLRPR